MTTNPSEAATPRRFLTRNRVLAGVTAGFVAIGLAAAGAAYADRGGERWGGGFGGGRMIERMLDRVDATDEQRTRIRAIFEAARNDLSNLREERRAAMGDLVELLQAPTLDRAAIEGKRAQRFATLETASKRMTQALADAAEVLTPEQRRIVAALIEDRMERGGRRDRRN
jgi:Spy/CpxP family protein refolding chaperone